MFTLSSVSLAVAEGSGQPAELPPATYKGQQYVDTEGCVFLRAGTEAETIWIPRVTAGGKQLCGYPPSGKRVPVVGEAGADEGGFDEAAVEEPSEADVAPAVAPEPADAASYVVALGSFGFASNVDKAAAGAEALGYPAIKGKLKGGEQGLVTVFAGPFGSKAEAEAAQKKLRKAGFPDAILMEY
jgi:ABC-type transport system substrate-binding protein